MNNFGLHARDKFAGESWWSIQSIFANRKCLRGYELRFSTMPLCRLWLPHNDIITWISISCYATFWKEPRSPVDSHFHSWIMRKFNVFFGVSHSKLFNEHDVRWRWCDVTAMADVRMIILCSKNGIFLIFRILFAFRKKRNYTSSAYRRRVVLRINRWCPLRCV